MEGNNTPAESTAEKQKQIRSRGNRAAVIGIIFISLFFYGAYKLDQHTELENMENKRQQDELALLTQVAVGQNAYLRIPWKGGKAPDAKKFICLGETVEDFNRITITRRRADAGIAISEYDWGEPEPKVKCVTQGTAVILLETDDKNDRRKVKVLEAQENMVYNVKAGTTGWVEKDWVVSK
jgi:hypothetical protein